MPTDPLVPLTDRPLDALVAGYLADHFTESPVSATLLGVAGYDDRLPDLTAAAERRRQAADDAWTERFTALSDGELTAAERIDRDLVLADLRGRLVMRDWQQYRRDPDGYTGAGLTGVFGLFLHRLAPPAELAASAAARLDAVPDLLAAGRAQLDPELADPMLLRRAVAQARGGADYCRSTVPGLVPDVPALAAAGERAAVAYDGWAAFLTDLADRATGGYAIGEARYSALLRDKEGLSYGAHELRERGLAEHAALVEDLRRRTRELAGHDDWQAYLAELDRDAPATPEDMLAGYRVATERARTYAYERGLVSEPAGETCLVVPAEEFQRAVLAVAFYYTPPAFASGPAGRIGHFFVPYPPATATGAQVRDRLGGNAYSAMPTISVHEAYPGHHWHFAWLAATNPRPLRSVLWTSYFVEGWALYVEQLLREEGFFTDPRAELRQVHFRAFRAARIVADTNLHLGDWTVEDAATYIHEQAALPVGVARAEAERYCAWPTQAPSYLTGALEIGRMRDEWLAAGRGTLREFHDRVAGSGGLPIALAERALLD